MNIVQGILIVGFIALIRAQLKMWDDQVLLVFLLPVGAMALIVTAAGVVLALFDNSVMMEAVWISAFVCQWIALAIIAIGDFVGEER